MATKLYLEINKYQILLCQNLAIRGLFTIFSNFKGMTMVFPPTDPHWLGKDKLKSWRWFWVWHMPQFIGGQTFGSICPKIYMLILLYL